MTLIDLVFIRNAGGKTWKKCSQSFMKNERIIHISGVVAAVFHYGNGKGLISK